MAGSSLVCASRGREAADLALERLDGGDLIPDARTQLAKDRALMVLPPAT
jgi:hypothetical protein